jgi:hypothetical protein
MTKRKKQRKNRHKQIGGETRRDLIKGVIVTVVGGEIVKYLPGPTPAVTTILRPAAASLKFTVGTPILKQAATS